MTLLVSSSVGTRLDIEDLKLERIVVLLWPVHTSVWTLQSDVFSTVLLPCWVTHAQNAIGSSASSFRLCLKELPSLSWKVSLSAHEKLHVSISAFDNPCLLGQLLAHLPASVSF